MKRTGDFDVLTRLPAIEREADSKPLNMRLLARLFRLTRPHARQRNILLGLAALRSIQLTSLVGLIPMIIKGPLADGRVSGVVWGALAMLALALFTQATLYFRQILALRLGEAVVHDMRNGIFHKLQTLSMSFFDRTRLGRIISRITSDADAVRVGVQDVFFVSLVVTGQMLVAAWFMLWLDRVLFLAVLALAPVVYFINRRFRTALSRTTRAMQESFSRVTSTLAESVGGIRVTLGFVRQELNTSMFRALVTDHAHYNLAVVRTSGAFVPLLDLNNQLFIAVLLLLGGWRVLHGLTDVEDVIGFFLLLNQFFAPILTLGNLYTQAMTSMAGAERVFHLLDREPEIVEPPSAVDLPALRGRVEFDDVSFGYLPKRLVLHHISFSAEPGQTVALVGHTGCGKTTLISLIAKFYLPTEGRLTFDGHDIRDTRGASLHRQMGLVQQQNFLFSGTVMDNIRVGNPRATDSQVIDAARRLDIHDWFEELPEGFQTAVGERGSNLSLGQRQLVCFTRAVLADPRILILDEATSSVDAHTEARIQKALAALLHGRTSFVVAHRLSTVRHADLVLVLEQGRIVERGTHTSLLAAGGLYAGLYADFVGEPEG